MPRMQANRPPHPNRKRLRPLGLHRPRRMPHERTRIRIHHQPEAGSSMNNTTWKTQGLCYGHPNPDLWFPADARRRGTFEAAQQICAECPVRTACRDYAETMQVSHGVWAGTNRNKPVKVSIPPPHGTEARARRERRAGGDPCPACLEGERVARRQRESRRSA